MLKRQSHMYSGCPSTGHLVFIDIEVSVMSSLVNLFIFSITISIVSVNSFSIGFIALCFCIIWPTMVIMKFQTISALKPLSTISLDQRFPFFNALHRLHQITFPLFISRCSHAYVVCEGAWHACNACNVWLTFGTHVLHVMHDNHPTRLSSQI